MSDIYPDRFLILYREPARGEVLASSIAAVDRSDAQRQLDKDQESPTPCLKDPVDEHVATLTSDELRVMANQADKFLLEDYHVKLEFSRAVTITVPEGFWGCVQELTRDFKITTVIRATRFGGQLEAISNKGRVFYNKCSVPGNRVFVSEVIRLADQQDITCITFKLNVR